MDFSQLIIFLNQRLPINYFKQELNRFIDEKQQAQLYDLIEKIAAYNAYYCKLFLKQYISTIELNGQEIIEQLYELYCTDHILNAVELSINDYDVLCYSFPSFKTNSNINFISDEIKANGVIASINNIEPPSENLDDSNVSILIQENPKVISGHNTTGLRTWEAAIYLSNFLLTNHELVGNSTVLELGAGTGLVSIALIKSNVASSVIITDGSPNLFDNLGSSLSLNNLQGLDKVKCQQLLWGHQDNDESGLPVIDYIVGADITYDSSILNELSISIQQFLSRGTKAAYIAATVRNESTINDWETILNEKFNWEVIDTCLKPEQLTSNYWYKPGTPEIRVYKITEKLYQ